jgi:2-polyprenyl-3-methyl-5-hydroxy-6-metoxy-1,4-benzoquinol methylase
MEHIIEKILTKILLKDPVHANKLISNLKGMEAELYPASESFFLRYEFYLKQNALTLDFAVDCYLKLCSDMLKERWHFMKTGNYTRSTFAESKKLVYNDPKTMIYHMNGLVLAQFLWFDQFERFRFFKENISSYTSSAKKYLEVGGGHGLYLLEALRTFDQECKFKLVDISKSSIELAKGIINDEKVEFILKDIFDMEETGIDFFSMGEVLEHLENPSSFLKKLSSMLNKNAKGFISTPVNSPMIDHIYLFNNENEIRTLLNNSGFNILKEKIVISEHTTPRLAEKFKIPIMYAAFVELK